MAFTASWTARLEYANQTEDAPGDLPPFVTMVVEAMEFQSVTTLPAWIIPQVKTNSATKTQLAVFHCIFLLVEGFGKILLPEPHARNHRRNRNAARILFFCYSEATRPWTLKFLKLLSFFWPGQTATRPRWMRSHRASTRNSAAWPATSCSASTRNTPCRRPRWCMRCT